LTEPHKPYILNFINLSQIIFEIININIDKINISGKIVNNVYDVRFQQSAFLQEFPMVKQEISLNPEPVVVTIRAHADLVVSGWEPRELSIEGGSRHSFSVRQDGNAISITASEDCLIMLPADSRVIVERVGGDAHISHLTGDLVCQKIGGDLTLLQVGRIAVEQVGGDCQVLQVAGDLESHKVGSDFIGKDVQGATLIEKVGGDFLLQGAGGAVNSRAGGDVRVSLSQLQGGSSNLAAGGDIQIHLPPEAGVALKVSSGGETIRIDLAGHSEIIEEHFYETQTGDAQVSLSLKAGGDVTITDRPWDETILDGLEEDIKEHFHFQSREEDWNQHIQDITQRTVNEATRRAEKRVQAALERIERRTQNFDPMAGRLHPMPFSTEFPFKPPRPAPPPQPSEPVSNDERMMILKMVESKKISVEEAEKLLEALEGK
jgi:hypothetical protein